MHPIAHEDGTMQLHGCVCLNAWGNNTSQKMTRPHTENSCPTSLFLEYAVGNPVFAKKIDSLSHSFSSMRRTRGDGNCFYRAFIFSYLEGLLLHSQLLECTRYGTGIDAGL